MMPLAPYIPEEESRLLYDQPNFAVIHHPIIRPIVERFMSKAGPVSMIAGYAKRDIIEIIRTDDQRIAVLTNGLAEDFIVMVQIWQARKQPPTQDEVENFLDRYEGISHVPAWRTA